MGNKEASFWFDKLLNNPEALWDFIAKYGHNITEIEIGFRQGGIRYLEELGEERYTDGVHPRLERTLARAQTIALWCDYTANNIDPTPLITVCHRLKEESKLVIAIKNSKPENPLYWKSPKHAEVYEEALNKEFKKMFRDAYIAGNRMFFLAERLIEDQAAGKMPNSRLTPDQCDILKMIRETGHRLTTKELADKLQEGGTPQSEGMLKQHLAEFTRHDILNNDRNSQPPGYGLPSWNGPKLGPS